MQLSTSWEWTTQSLVCNLQLPSGELCNLLCFRDPLSNCDSVAAIDRSACPRSQHVHGSPAHAIASGHSVTAVRVKMGGEGRAQTQKPITPNTTCSSLRSTERTACSHLGCVVGNEGAERVSTARTRNPGYSGQFWLQERYRLTHRMMHRL